MKVLAEPNIMAISGQEASFLAGGKIFIPVAQDSRRHQHDHPGRKGIRRRRQIHAHRARWRAHQPEGGAGSVGTEQGRHRHHRRGGTTATAILPAFTTRRATTTVQLHDGQSFAIGGLIKNNVTSNIKRCRCWARFPVLGALFRSSDFQTDRTELVFIITPHLVKPLPALRACRRMPMWRPAAPNFSCKARWKAPRTAAPEPAPSATVDMQ